jgi:hypothetical protein
MPRIARTLERDDAQRDLPHDPPSPTGRARTPWRHGAALWWLLMACESVNGSLRELVLEPWLGAVGAGRLSFALAALLVLAVATIFAPWMQARTQRAQLHIGLLWAALTLAFEAALARVMDVSLDAFLADYDPARGGPMLAGLLILALAPMLGARLAHAMARH